MRLDTLPADHVMRATCPQCGEAGEFTVAELLMAYGPDITFADLPELMRCPSCRVNLKVDAGLH